MYFTQAELVENQKQNLFLLDTQMHHHQINVEDIADLIPGYLHINQLKNYNLKFADEKCEDFLQLSLEEMIKMGDQLILDYFHPYTSERIIPEIIEFGNQKDYKKVFGFMQKIRKGYNGRFNSFIGFCKVSKGLNAFITIENPVSVFRRMTQKLNKLIDDAEFVRKNFKKFASLTKREIEIMRLIGSGKSRNYISEILNISIHTVDNHRKHIRQKLDVNNTAGLCHYIKAFDLI